MKLELETYIFLEKVKPTEITEYLYEIGVFIHVRHS